VPLEAGLLPGIPPPYTGPSVAPRFHRSSAPPGPTCAQAFQEAMREEDLPAQQPEAQQDPRLPHSHADSWRSGTAHPPSSQGTSRPVSLIWRVRDRASFRALATGRRHRRGVLTMTRIPGREGDPPRVAFAVGRPVGNAVARNRVRRRLRSLIRAHRDELAGGHDYLLGASPKAVSATYRELDSAFCELLRATAAGS
jgi:ribonuclease P protein component